MEFINDKDKHKFEVALINSKIVYWYMDDLENDGYNKRIEEVLNWTNLTKELKQMVKYTRIVKEYIKKYNISETELRSYCFNLEHNNPRSRWQDLIRRR